MSRFAEAPVSAQAMGINPVMDLKPNLSNTPVIDNSTARFKPQSIYEGFFQRPVQIGIEKPVTTKRIISITPLPSSEPISIATPTFESIRLGSNENNKPSFVDKLRAILHAPKNENESKLSQLTEFVNTISMNYDIH